MECSVCLTRTFKDTVRSFTELGLMEETEQIECDRRP